MRLYKCLKLHVTSHNPYFNRWFSAMQLNHSLVINKRHNPYFNRWFSAMKVTMLVYKQVTIVTILILIDGFLQFYIQHYRT